MKIICLESVDSTNEYLMREADLLEAPVLVAAKCQTAGHGQRGNSWESAPGENLTFSILVRPVAFSPMLQFHISEAVALAVVDFLANHGIEAKVKWPNDIYVGDRKICGILIRHSIAGDSIAYSVLGVGINVNQTEFLSDAPNPVSMAMVSGEKYPVENLYEEIGECIESRLQKAWTATSRESLHQEFMNTLWRGDGNFHPFIDTATGESFTAAIHSISPQGPITLRLPDDTHRTYSFKELSFNI